MGVSIVETIHREEVYLWYYFDIQLRQILSCCRFFFKERHEG